MSSSWSSTEGKLLPCQSRNPWFPPPCPVDLLWDCGTALRDLSKAWSVELAGLCLLEPHCSFMASVSLSARCCVSQGLYGGSLTAAEVLSLLPGAKVWSGFWQNWDPNPLGVSWRFAFAMPFLLHRYPSTAVIFLFKCRQIGFSPYLQSCGFQDRACTWWPGSRQTPDTWGRATQSLSFHWELHFILVLNRNSSLRVTASRRPAGVSSAQGTVVSVRLPWQSLSWWNPPREWIP